ncbi:MAG: RloB domain-containing protein, partial [Bacteroidaceae bacterium]|nr:RloB domain-containing protein [Bacteroidaceae bacterium]
MLHLRSLCGLSYDMKSKFFSVTSPKDMRKKIDEVLKEQGFAVCVFDMDVFENNLTSLLEYQSLISDYSKNDVLFCETMPSIEYWFLLHYVNKN